MYPPPAFSYIHQHAGVLKIYNFNAIFTDFSYSSIIYNISKWFIKYHHKKHIYISCYLQCWHVPFYTLIASESWIKICHHRTLQDHTLNNISCSHPKMYLWSYQVGIRWSVKGLYIIFSETWLLNKLIHIEKNA
jgi:hypothetical protein